MPSVELKNVKGDVIYPVLAFLTLSALFVALWLDEKDFSPASLRVGYFAMGLIEAMVIAFAFRAMIRKQAEIDHVRKVGVGAMQELDLLLANAKDFIYRHDRDGVFHYLSPSVTRITGRTQEEWCTHYTEYLTDSEINKAVVQNTEYTLETGVETRPYLVEILHKDGYPVTLEVNEQPYFEGGKVAGLVGVARDVTERLKAERALRESEERFRTIIEHAPEAVLLLDTEKGNFVEVNSRAESLFEYSRDELLSMGPAGISPEFQPDGNRSADAVLENVEKAVLDGSNVFEWMHRTKSGADLVCEVNLVLIRHEGRKLVRGSIMDITERKSWEQQLQISEERYRKLIESASDAILVADAMSGEILDVNRRAESLFGRPRDELVGMQEISLHPAGITESRRKVFEIVAKAGSFAEEFDEIVRSDGTVVPVGISVAAFNLGERKVISGFYRDLSERKRAEEERKQLEAQIQYAQKLESLGVLAGGIAHDFNNLLVGVLGNASFALSELPAESAVTPIIKQVQIAARRAADLTNQMLAYSGKGKFLVETVNIATLVKEMTNLLSVSISKKATIRYVSDTEAPLIEGDASQIRQVVMNLITNASDALEDKEGIISVITGSLYCEKSYLKDTYFDEELDPGMYAYLEVSDTGCGMDAQTRAKIFDPFFTTKFTGRGLGLAAVLGIIRGHKGAIKVYSEPGRGTTIKVLFPGTDKTPIPKKVEVEPSAIEKFSGTILVVDDEVAIRLLAQRVLTKAGFRVLLARDGQEAVDVFGANREAIRLVLLDMTLPKMSGEQVFRSIRMIDQSVKVLLTSGYNEQDATSRFAGKGLAGFIQKPYEPSDLLAKIAQILAEN
ncbi:MAG: PAS domain S-box protein [Planctomycetes bacterium]|nr:PAS domain S-box protein [Planctomycetota bacterium]